MEMNYLISKEAMLNLPILKVLKNQAAFKLDEMGNFNLYIVSSQISPEEMDAFLNDEAKIYYFSRGGKTAIIFEWCVAIESAFCPLKSSRESLELFMDSEEAQIACYLYDSTLGDIVGTRVLKIAGTTLNAIKESFIKNCSYTPSELNEWVRTTLSCRHCRKNIKDSLYIGKTIPTDSQIILF